jgi:hypothetical protein
MSEHTPGPWRAVAIDHGGVRETVREYTITGPTIHVARVNLTRQATVADVQAMAAAPELLDALKNLLHMQEDTPCRIDSNGVCRAHGGRPCVLEAARDAIARAEGK